ncbi:hypothetical protein KKI93_22285 [Xenorhabdus bovienii]|uniref:hypothetical protein n=1 Tax=Xenorhabdus bovienii TaxID=40576 RepID=UPI0023B33E48|nr:hypothetical protein [Xenorhabdus bovienii]MDE9566659.1 hypothetical protein [Xenorhabdus bovienii]
MKTSDKTLLTDALQLVQDAIELHQNGKNAPLSIDVLAQVKKKIRGNDKCYESPSLQAILSKIYHGLA